MSNHVPTPESLKDKAKLTRKFLKEKCGVEISHGHCLELTAQLFNFKDWNTATASLKSKDEQNLLPFYIRTVGDLKKALKSFEDSDIIDAMYEFKAKEFIDELAAEELGPEDVITQEFSFVLKHPRDSDGIASLNLNLEDESMEMSL